MLHSGKRGESGALGKIHFPWIQSKTGYHLYERNPDIKDENGAVIKETSGIHPEIFIREVLKDYKSPKIEGFPTFTGGLVGYFSYDYLKYSEKKLVLDAKDEEGFQDVDLMLLTR